MRAAVADTSLGSARRSSAPAATFTFVAELVGKVARRRKSSSTGSDRRVVKDHYWLRVGGPKKGQRLDARLDGQKLVITTKDVGSRRSATRRKLDPDAALTRVVVCVERPQHFDPGPQRPSVPQPCGVTATPLAKNARQA